MTSNRVRFVQLLSPVHTSNNVEAALSNATMSNVASAMLLVWTGLNGAFTPEALAPGSVQCPALRFAVNAALVSIQAIDLHND